MSPRWGKPGGRFGLTGALILGTLLQGLVAAGALGWIDLRADQAYRQSLLPAVWLTQIRADVGVITTTTATFRYVNSDQQRGELRTTIAQAEADLDTRIVDYQGQASPRGRDLLQRFITAWQRWRDLRDTQLYPRVDAGQQAQVEALFLNEVLPTVAAAQSGLAELAAAEAASGKDAANDSHRYYVFLQIAIVLAGALVLRFGFRRIVAAQNRGLEATHVA